jgi:hypothetical protein
MGGGRILHNEELHNLYSLLIIIIIKIKEMRWLVHLAQIGKMRKTRNILVGKPEGMKQLWRSRHKWEDIIKMDL